MPQKLLPPPTQCPIATPTGSLTTAWGNYFTLLSNNLLTGGTGAPTTAQYVLSTRDLTGTLQSGQVLADLSSGFVKVVTGSGQLESTLSDQIQPNDLANTAVIPGVYGSGTEVPIITIDAQGRIDSATQTFITGATPSGPAGGVLTGTYPNPGITTLNQSTTGNAATATFATTAGSAAPSGTAGGVLTGTYPNPGITTLNQSTTGNAATATLASTVTTNANLTGPITSTGNATSVTSQTGTGSTFVMSTSPTLVTPALGTPSSGTLTNCTFPTLNQNTTGNAATVTTNANLTGDVTSSGNATTYHNIVGISKGGTGVNNTGTITNTDTAGINFAPTQYSVLNGTLFNFGTPFTSAFPSTVTFPTYAGSPLGIYNLIASDTTANGTAGQILVSNGNASPATWTTVSTGSGSVTSVGFVGDGVVFDSGVTSGPITVSGNLQPTILQKFSNTFLAGPNSGATLGTPSYRTIVAADIANAIPPPTSLALGGVFSISSTAHKWVNNIDTTGTPNVSQPAFADISGTATTSQLPTVPVNKGGTGTTSYTNGQLLIGNTTGNTLTVATLTAGTGISVTNSGGGITIANTGITSLPVGTLLGITRFTSSGTYTRNTAATTVIFDVLGAGGGSGGVNDALGAGNWNTVGGGGAGNRIQCSLTSTQVGTSATVTIGAAGTAGASGSNNGGTGGNTTVACTVGTITANGGAGSPTSANLGGSFTFNSGGLGGAVGTSQGTSLLNVPGQGGAVGMSGGVTSAGFSGKGGDTAFGSGGPGITSTAAGTAGTGFGAGAGGGLINGSSTAGAAGSAGVVFIYEYS